MSDMKRPYFKPKLYAEEFSLVEHIANCTVKTQKTAVTYRDRSSCSYTDANLSLFNDGVTGCANDYDDSMYDSFADYLKDLGNDGSGCYNAFSDGNFFAS